MLCEFVIKFWVNVLRFTFFHRTVKKWCYFLCFFGIENRWKWSIFGFFCDTTTLTLNKKWTIAEKKVSVNWDFLEGHLNMYDQFQLISTNSLEFHTPNVKKWVDIRIERWKRSIWCADSKFERIRCANSKTHLVSYILKLPLEQSHVNFQTDWKNSLGLDRV